MEEYERILNERCHKMINECNDNDELMKGIDFEMKDMFASLLKIAFNEKEVKHGNKRNNTKHKRS